MQSIACKGTKLYKLKQPSQQGSKVTSMTRATCGYIARGFQLTKARLSALWFARGIMIKSILFRLVCYPTKELTTSSSARAWRDRALLCNLFFGIGRWWSLISLNSTTQRRWRRDYLTPSQARCWLSPGRQIFYFPICIRFIARHRRN